MYSDKNARELLAFLSTGMSIAAAAEASVGVSRRTVQNWYSHSVADADAGLLFDSRFRLDDWPKPGCSVWFHEACDAVRDGRVRVTRFHGREVPDRFYKMAKDTTGFKAVTGEPIFDQPDPVEVAAREARKVEYLPPPSPPAEPEWAKPQTPLRRDLESRRDDLLRNGPKHQTHQIEIFGRNEAAGVAGEANQPARPEWARPGE